MLMKNFSLPEPNGKFDLSTFFAKYSASFMEYKSIMENTVFTYKQSLFFTSFVLWLNLFELL